MSMTKALKAAIAKDGRSLLAMEAETGVSVGVFSRFLRDQRSITLRTADQIVSGLGLSVKISKATKPKK